MRVKETADDYRMYPDPDLVPFDLSDEFVERCRARVPELPDAKRSRYVSAWGLKPYDAARIAGEPAMASLFEAAAQAVGTSEVPMVANVVVNLVFGREDLMPRQVAGLARLLAGDAITFAQARELVELVAGTDRDPEKTADERGLRQSTDVQALADIVETVLQTCDDQVRQYRAGNKKVVGFLVGQCMKASHGNGNPKLFHQLLTQRLES